jgi:hypothetical protein
LYLWTEQKDFTEVSSAAEHFAVAQIIALIKKAPFDWETLGLPRSPLDQAKATFFATEVRCKEVNRRLRTRLFGSYSFKIDYMRRWICHVLGDKPNLLAVYDKGDISSGASIGVHGNATNLYRKLYAESWSVTRCALPYARGFFKRNNHLAMNLYQEHGQYVCFDDTHLAEEIAVRANQVSYNQLSFVPKTVKTHRVIAIEPLLNSILQNGVDNLMREKLKRWGYDLRDQGKNQHLARLGSESGEYATMDLKAASDSITIELARVLLPPDWFDFLNQIRSACYKLDGEISRYEKFCSMGNGFCFPLETLFFAAAARAVMHERTDGVTTHSVYGDDIIVPTDCYEELADLLLYLGFETNLEKSFSTGPFRESCGADWYEGQDVRPVYLDYPLNADVHLRIFHNATLRGTRTTWWFENIRPILRKKVHADFRFLRPFDRRKAEKVQKEFVGYDEKFITIANLNGAFDVDIGTFMASRWASWSRDEWRWQWKEALYTSLADSSTDPNFEKAQYLALLRGSPEGKLALRRKTRMSIAFK